MGPFIFPTLLRLIEELEEVQTSATYRSQSLSALLQRSAAVTSSCHTASTRPQERAKCLTKDMVECKKEEGKETNRHNTMAKPLPAPEAAVGTSGRAGRVIMGGLTHFDCWLNLLGSVKTAGSKAGDEYKELTG
ncbi:unnamed protein product [Pleuronectes platessa]|uniref:Uncharacterized protein n=1 Tax=Pleuronectes platessa TaxID=8262 RepID=A0A9N7TY17_PLEPL|nr:unnamed protein product [Pleuronectes platessa]